MSLYNYKALVDRVVDGDTIDVTIDCGFSVYVKERIRLAGIDTPETYGVKKGSEEYLKGMEAKTFVEDLIMGLNVSIETLKDKKGKYGRYIARIYIMEDDARICLNDVLVEKGLAKSVTY